MLKAQTKVDAHTPEDKMIIRRLESKRHNYSHTLKLHANKGLTQNVVNILCAKIDSLTEHIDSYDLDEPQRKNFLSEKDTKRSAYLQSLLVSRNNSQVANDQYVAYTVYMKHIAQIEKWINEVKGISE